MNSTPKQAIARMRSSLVAISADDPTQPVGSGVIVRGADDEHAIVATALHVVRGVETEDLQVGVPVPPSDQARGGLMMLGATVVATDEPNDLALLELEHNTPLTRGVSLPSGGRSRATVAELEAGRPEDGESVMISGFPLGYRYVVNSAGIIACAWGDQGIDHVLEDEHGFAPDGLLDRYLVDINVNPGNSGGPCYRTADQRVLGICEALQLVEVAFDDSRLDVDVEAVVVDEAQRAALQKADITFVIPATYVVALLEDL